jgi:hypothetical protein
MAQLFFRKVGFLGATLSLPGQWLDFLFPIPSPNQKPPPGIQKLKIYHAVAVTRAMRHEVGISPNEGRHPGMGDVSGFGIPYAAYLSLSYSASTSRLAPANSSKK